MASETLAVGDNSTSSSSTTTTTTTTTTVAPDSSANATITDSEDINNNGTKPLEQEFETFNGKNLTEVSANDTLKDSELLKVDVNNTSPEEIKNLFCKEIGTIVNRYDVREKPFQFTIFLWI